MAASFTLSHAHVHTHGGDDTERGVHQALAPDCWDI